MSKALNLDVDEKVILEVRKHWIVFLPATLIFFVGTILPPVLYAVWNSSLLPAQVHFSLSEDRLFLALFIYCFWVLALWISFFLQWTNYYLDVWYVTNKRIIDIDQKGIFHREVSNLRFDKIQDISVEVKGIIATFFNFGNIRVQTASEDSKEFFIHNVAKPETAKKVIFSQQHVVAEKDQTVRIVKGDETVKQDDTLI